MQSNSDNVMNGISQAAGFLNLRIGQESSITRVTVGSAKTDIIAPVQTSARSIIDVVVASAVHGSILLLHRSVRDFAAAFEISHTRICTAIIGL
jgi:hypothetical protein